MPAAARPIIHPRKRQETHYLAVSRLIPGRAVSSLSTGAKATTRSASRT